MTLLRAPAAWIILFVSRSVSRGAMALVYAARVQRSQVNLGSVLRFFSPLKHLRAVNNSWGFEPPHIPGESSWETWADYVRKEKGKSLSAVEEVAAWCHHPICIRAHLHRIVMDAAGEGRGDRNGVKRTKLLSSDWRGLEWSDFVPVHWTVKSNSNKNCEMRTNSRRSATSPPMRGLMREETIYSTFQSQAHVSSGNRCHYGTNIYLFYWHI